MSFEVNNQNENLPIDTQRQEEQAQKEFDNILKEYQKMTVEEQAAFIEAIANKDPAFQELYDQLQSYFWGQIEHLDSHLQSIELSKSFEAEAQRTRELMQTEESFFESNKDFSNYISGVTLTPEVYSAYLRYQDNPEPLIKALAGKELQQAQSEYEASKQAIRTSMQYAPENMDRAYEFSHAQMIEKQQKILDTYTHIAEDFAQLIETDAGQLLLSNTVYTTFENNLKTNINKNLGYEENSETPLATIIENNTKTLISNISSLEGKLAQEISDFQSFQENLKQRDYIIWERILYQDIPSRYEGLINTEIKNYAFSVGKSLIASENSVIQEGRLFQLPLGDGNQLRLDFGELPDVNFENKEEVLEAFENNFDSIYRNDLGEKLGDVFSDIGNSVKENPGKTAIDVSSVVFSGIGAVLISQGTLGAGIPLAGLSFTVFDNAYRAGMYEVFDIEGGWEAGVGIEESDTHNDIIRKKLFELGGNTLLFGMFRGTGLLEDKAISKFFTEEQINQISFQAKSLGIKTGVEASFFTYYSVVSENLQHSFKQDGNTNEMLDSFTDIPNMEALLKSYIYNFGFITAVKAGAFPAERVIINKYQKQLNNELEGLKEKGIVLVETSQGPVFFQGNNRMTELRVEDFQAFLQLNQKVSYLATEQYRKPESGRGGKSTYSKLPRDEKFRKLEEYSNEAQSGKMEYALNDKTIGDTLMNSGMQEGKGVGEGLLKKAGFDRSEIRDFKEGRLKSERAEKTLERNALREMERANEMIYKEYKKAETAYLQGKSVSEIFPQLSNEIKEKIKIMIRNEIKRNY